MLTAYNSSQSMRIIDRPGNVLVPNERSKINLNPIFSQLFNLGATITQEIPHIVVSVGNVEVLEPGRLHSLEQMKHTPRPDIHPSV